MRTTPEQLQQSLTEPEGTLLEFKEAKSRYDFEKLLQLEVVSPGGFPPGVTPANVLDQQSPRNRRLAEAPARCGLIERSGHHPGPAPADCNPGQPIANENG